MSEAAAPQRPLSPHLQIYQVAGDDGDVDPASGHGHWAWRWDAGVGVVAGGGVAGPDAYARVRDGGVSLARAVGVVRVYARARLSRAERRAALRLGMWATASRLTRRMRAGLIVYGATVVVTLVVWIAGLCFDGGALMSIQTPLGRVRGLGSAKSGRRAFLASAADGGGACCR